MKVVIFCEHTLRPLNVINLSWDPFALARQSERILITPNMGPSSAEDEEISPGHAVELLPVRLNNPRWTEERFIFTTKQIGYAESLDNVLLPAQARSLNKELDRIVDARVRELLKK